MAKRELIEPNKGDKRFVRRDGQGQFKESDDVGKALTADRRTKAKNVAKPGQGDKGDRKTTVSKSNTQDSAKRGSRATAAAKGR